jgi:hypothetical protein
MSKLLKRLSDAARSGVYRTPFDVQVLDATRGSTLDVVRIDLGKALTKQALLDATAAALGFPAWFGGNWDALEDCLCDLSWRRGVGHVFLFGGVEGLPRDDLGVLRDILASAAEFWSGRGKPFFAVFVGAANPLQVPELFRRET